MNVKHSPKFSRIIPTINFSEQFIRVHNVFLTSIVQDIWFFLGSKKSRTKSFKIEATVPKKKILAHSFSYYPLWQTLSFLLLDSTKYLGKYGASCKIISLGPKRLFKTKIFCKNATFSVRKCICLIIYQIVECDKPQETIYKGQKDFLTINVEVIRSFFETKEVVENTNFWEKGNFLVYKYIFSVFS